jgi:hypothetical protein
VMPPYQFWGEHLVLGFPSVIGLGVALPFDQVLQLAPSSVITVVSNGLDFVFLLVVDYFGGGFCKVGPVFFRLAIRSQQACVEDVMDGPGRG